MVIEIKPSIPFFDPFDVDADLPMLTEMYCVTRGTCGTSYRSISHFRVIMSVPSQVK